MKLVTGSRGCVGDSRKSGDGAVAFGLVCGWVLDAMVGDPHSRHPVAAFGRAASYLEAKIWQPSRVRGLAFTLFLVAPLTGVMFVAHRGLIKVPKARRLLMTLTAWTVIGGRSLGREANRLADAVERGDLVEARRIAPALVGRDPSELDAAELCRAAVESVAENTADAVVGPLVWGALAGPAGASAYRAANTLDAMVGHRTPRYELFGWASARLDDVMTWVPARLSALLSVLLAPLVGGNARRSWKTLRRYGASHPSPNAGRLEAAFAGALGVRLGGTNRYQDVVDERPIIGEGPRPDPTAVRRAARLSGLTGAVALAVCALIALRPDR